MVGRRGCRGAAPTGAETLAARAAQRQRVQRAVHAALRGHGYGEREERLQVLRAVTGREATSTSDLSLPELLAVLDRLNGRPAQRGDGGRLRRYSRPTVGDPAPPVSAKIRAIWIEMAGRGWVSADEAALDKWVARMVGIEHVGWLDRAPDEARRAIEALKKWRSRLVAKAQEAPRAAGEAGEVNGSPGAAVGGPVGTAPGGAS